MSSHIKWLVNQRRKVCFWVRCTIIVYPGDDTVHYRTGGKFQKELIIVSLETVWWAFCTCEGAFSSCLCQRNQCTVASEGKSTSTGVTKRQTLTGLYHVKNNNLLVVAINRKFHIFLWNSSSCIYWSIRTDTDCSSRSDSPVFLSSSSVIWNGWESSIKQRARCPSLHPPFTL